MTSRLSLFGKNRNLSALADRYLWTAAVVLVLAVIIGLLEGVGISLLIPLLSTFAEGFAPAPGKGSLRMIQELAQGHSRDQRLIIVSSVILGFVLLKSAFQIVANNFSVWVDGRVGHDIRRGLVARMNGVGYSFFLEQQPARLVNILNTESWKASEAVRVLLTRIANGAAVCVFAVLLVIVSWRLSLLVVVGGLITRAVQRKGELRLQVISQEAVTANQLMVGRGLFSVFGSRVIRLFNSQDAEQTKFDLESDGYRRANLKAERLAGTLGPILEAMHGLLFLVVLLTAVFTGVSLPVLAAFLVLMNRLQPHLRILEQSAALFASAAAHFDEVEWLLEPEGKPASPTGQTAFEGFEHQIRFDGVTFDYGARGEPALFNATLTLRKGRHTAIVGQSGSGKSTLVCLLCRLFDPTSGSISVDGKPLVNFRPADWLAMLAVSGQDVDLVDGTIAENIRYGRTEIEDALVREAAHTAHANFVMEMPQQFDTLVGSRGLSLSGGQRQRIGIARALARRPKLLILDEATNALDEATEAAIFSNLREWPEPITIVVISHKMSNLAFCDDAVVLNRGQVVDGGPIDRIFRNLSSQTVAEPFGQTAAPSA